MNAIIISDLHIGSKFSLSHEFENFLDNMPDDDELFLNGDIIDNPIVKLRQKDQQILSRVEKISYRQKVVWVRGNHDNGYIPTAIGKIQIKKMHTIGRRLLIVHGDYFDEIMPRSKLFIRVFKLLHDLRVKLGTRPVHVAEYAKNWKRLYRVLRNNVMINAVNYATKNGFEAVTCGHTHFAEDRVYNGIRYINTGAWTEMPIYYLRVTAGDIVLRKLDDAYETPQFTDSDQFDPTPPSKPHFR